MSTYATLPQELIIEGVQYVQHFRSKTYAVYQNYDERFGLRDDDEPGLVLRSDRSPSMFHLYQIERLNPASEQLGQKLGTYSSVDAAVREAAKLGAS